MTTALYISPTFDDITMDTRLEDLGKFIGRHGNWELERTLFILQVYHGVNPISRAEVTALLAYLRFPFDFLGRRRRALRRQGTRIGTR